MSRPWGPQATGGVTLTPQAPRTGGYWVALAIVSPFLGLGLLIGQLLSKLGSNTTTCTTQDVASCTTTHTANGGAATLTWVVVVVSLVLGGLFGLRDGARGVSFAHGRTIAMVLVILCAALIVVGYAVGYVVARVLAKGGRAPKAEPAPLTPAAIITSSDNPHQALLSYTHYDPDGGGGVIGWDGDHFKTAPPRQAMLVIGPPGSMKTTAVIIPSVLAAIGACVTTSMKQEVLIATAGIRSTLGRNFQFDPSTTEPGSPFVTIAHWSPLVGIDGWDAAGRRARALAQPHIEASTGNGKHFVSHASQIIAILLYAAHLSGDDMTVVYRWVTTLTVEDTKVDLFTILDETATGGDEGAGIALDQFKGYAEMNDQELAKYVSSASEILEAYKYVSVRRISKDVNFDPYQFVRSRDTLHITVPSEFKDVFAPVVTALLDAIRNAAYEMHRQRELGREPERPHVTFVLDEVTNVAPIALPDLTSQAGGQGLHVVAAMQSNTQAIDRWKNAAKDFLSMFPTKLILPGVADPQVLNVLSELTGEYDRVMMGYGQSTSYVGQYHIPVTQQNPNWSIQRQRVLTPADISNPPRGCSVMFQGGQWSLVQLAPVFHQFWQLVIERTPTPALSAPADHSIGGPQVDTTHQFTKGEPR